MAGTRTLTVVRSLERAGIDVWAPTAMRRRYRPRSTKFTDSEAALLPGWAFARAEHLTDLLAIVHAPVSEHPPFRVLQRDEVPQLARDADLQSLRDYEARVRQDWEAFKEAAARQAKVKRKKTSARAYVLGQRVRVERPEFAGLEAEIVEIRKSGDLVLEFTGFLRGAAVPACDVVAIQLSDAKSEQTKAA